MYNEVSSWLELQSNRLPRRLYRAPRNDGKKSHDGNETKNVSRTIPNENTSRYNFHRKSLEVTVYIVIVGVTKLGHH